jgi:hypothetical protein
MSARVTEARIRDVCQINPSVNPRFQQFKLEKLIKDLNTVHGARIQLYDKTGRQRPAAELCGDIYSYIPDTSICMLRPSGRMPSVKDVARQAEVMNKKYGSTIVYFIDPLNPRSGYRTIPEICDQMNDVSSQVRRKLDDDLDHVREKLKRHINELDKLSDEFQKFGSAKLPSALMATISPATRTVDFSALISDLTKRNESVLIEIEEMEKKEKEALEQLKDRAVNKELEKPEVSLRLDLVNQANVGIINDLFQKLPIPISGKKEEDYAALVKFYMDLKNKARSGDPYSRKLYKENKQAFRLLKHGFSPLTMTTAQISEKANDWNNTLNIAFN